MKEFTYNITDENGLHARPAGLLVKEAGKYNCSVTLKSGDKSADAKRIFAVMSLSVKCGDSVTVITEGADEDNAATSLKAFFEENL
ncbi:MAG: HPr family phosphocarrier protein [Clostridia bacterium]|nr:HPr family phosphocarrier protein [Clostridia bacterium]